MKAINWKVRLKNPVFWAQVAAAVVSPILVGLGLQWEDMTTWPAAEGVLAHAEQLGQPLAPGQRHVQDGGRAHFYGAP